MTALWIIGALLGLWLAAGGFLCFFESKGISVEMLRAATLFIIGSALFGASSWGLLQ